MMKTLFLHTNYPQKTFPFLARATAKETLYARVQSVVRKVQKQSNSFETASRQLISHVAYSKLHNFKYIKSNI